MTKLHAVVVDDDRNLGITFKTVLELCGFQVEYISESQDAMEKIIAIQPALVMLDLQMPHVSGREILQQIRNHELLSNCKVIMLTANSYALRDEIINELADIILLKPATLNQIRDFASRLTDSDK